MVAQCIAGCGSTEARTMFASPSDGCVESATACRSAAGAVSRRFVWGLFIGLCAAGCGGTSTTPVIPLCTGPRTAIRVRVRDAQTGAFAGAGAIVIASLNATYADTSAIAGSDPDSTGANVADRPGSYNLIVRKTGYLEWNRA